MILKLSKSRIAYALMTIAAIIGILELFWFQGNQILYIAPVLLAVIAIGLKASESKQERKKVLKFLAYAMITALFVYLYIIYRMNS